MNGNITEIIDGAAMALHGALTSGECICLSKNNDYHGDGHAPASAAAVPRAADAGIAFMPDTAELLSEDHWIEFQLTDGRDLPIAHQPYVVVDPSGAEFPEHLDEIGFARYGRTWGLGDSEGAGILKIWNNFSAYIADENRYGRVTTGFVYETSEENAKKIPQFIERKTAGKKLMSEDRTKKKVRIEGYYALGPNCTTLSVDAIKTIFPDIDRDWSTFQKGRGLGMMEKTAITARGWPKYIFMPADLQVMLESPSAKKAKKVNK